MYTLRCTARLLARFKHDPRLVAAAGTAPTTTRLGDWYANRLNVGHQRLILCVSELSLLRMILSARNLDQLPQRLSESVGVLLELLGLPTEVIADEIGRMESVQSDRTANKSVLGSMTDFTHMAKPISGAVHLLARLFATCITALAGRSDTHIRLTKQDSC